MWNFFFSLFYKFIIFFNHCHLSCCKTLNSKNNKNDTVRDAKYKKYFINMETKLKVTRKNIISHQLCRGNSKTDKIHYKKMKFKTYKHMIDVLHFLQMHFPPSVRWCFVLGPYKTTAARNQNYKNHHKQVKKLGTKMPAASVLDVWSSYNKQETWKCNKYKHK